MNVHPPQTLGQTIHCESYAQFQTLPGDSKIELFLPTPAFYITNIQQAFLSFLCSQGCEDVRACALGGPKQSRIGQSQLTKSKGREVCGGEASKEFISERATLGRQRTNISETVSKVPEILLGLYGIRKTRAVVGTCRSAVKMKLIIVLESILSRTLLFQGSPIT